MLKFQYIERGLLQYGSRALIRHWRWENSTFTTQNSPANVRQPVTIFHSDMMPLSQYPPVRLHLSPATSILNENPDGSQWQKLFCLYVCFIIEILYIIFDSTHIAKWDINETKAGGPFEEILQYDIFVNNIKLTKVR